MIRPAIALALGLLSTAAFGAQAPAAPDGGTQLDAVAGVQPVDSVGQTEDLKFKTEGYDRMTVPVRLSGTGPYRFIVDTGADKTAVSRELAGRLKLAAGTSVSVHSVAGITTEATADLPDLEFTKKGVRIIDAPMLAQANIGADGILGVDSLKSQRVMFDFELGTMAIVPSRTPEDREEGAIVISAQRKKGRLLMTDAAANGRPVTVIIDTGSQITIGNNALREELLKKNLNDPLQKVNLISVTGASIPGDYMFVKEIAIGGLTLKNLAIVFADAQTFHTLKLDRTPAMLLGMNAMRAFKKVSIDFANKKFRVVLPEQSLVEVHYASARD
jgi:predicted aspartyl protease